MDRYIFPPQEQALIENMKVPFAVFQLVEKRIVTLAISQGFCDLLEPTDKSTVYAAMNRDTFRNVHPDDIARLGNTVAHFMRYGGRLECVYRLKKHGESGYLIIHAFGEHVYTDTGIRLGQIWFADEGTYSEDGERRGSQLNQSLSNALHENSIVRTSYYDYLTGLPSMTYFFELAETGKEMIRAKGENPVLMYMDFSGMRFYNSRHGFAEGDKLLRSFARVIIKLFGDEKCSRFSADHFVVQTEERGLDGKIQQLFSECQGLNEGKTLPLHIGVYPAQKERVHTSVACDRAKLACKALRGRYGMAVNYYTQDLNDDLEKKQYIIENIGRAIDEGWIQIYFQPIVRAVNEKVCDTEALARWIDPVRGFLSPADFIPALEESGLIYRLDLYMVEQLVKKLRNQINAGYMVVPCSVNLSRADFDACDIVEEIRRRVDAAGISRNMLTIEITESIIGNDFDFIKAQIERFQKLGFPVWMDDFGSGYSSLDVLQSIQFDLLKFDMSFMRKLDEGENGKIILTEMMRMATALGVDTVCEGVETEAQVRFLQEIGCSKLQGFYYSRPEPLEKILEKYKDGSLIQFENAEESSYYETIGRINLYDLAVIASAEIHTFQNSFNTIPMGIIEVKGDESRFVRTNQSYRNFLQGFFGIDLAHDVNIFRKSSSAFMHNVINVCCERGLRSVYDETMPDGSVVHSFARRIGMNPVTGTVAVGVAVLSVTDPNEGASYPEIARALAADYYNIYVVNLDTDKYIEYTSRVGEQEMALERHGDDFFESSKRDAYRIYVEDRKAFYEAFSKAQLIEALNQRGVFTATYRLVDTGVPVRVNMKVTRMSPGSPRIIMGISVDENPSS